MGEGRERQVAVKPRWRFNVSGLFASGFGACLPEVSFVLVLVVVLVLESGNAE